MAVCERRSAQVVQPPDEFVLTLSEAEAIGLRALIGWRVGCSALQMYGLTGVWDALRDAKVPDSTSVGRGVVGFLQVKKS